MNNFRLFRFYINGRLSRWTGISDKCFVAWGWRWNAWPVLRQDLLACLLPPRDALPHLTINWSLRAPEPLSPKLEACTYFWQLWNLYCRVTSQARNLHQRAKKNTSKNKHESQDFMPGTPATHILLAGSLASLLTVLLLLNWAEACSGDLDLMSAPGSYSSVLKLFHGVAKWFKSRKEGNEVIRR